MRIQKFRLGHLETNSYLVYNRKEAILIDCGGEPERIIDFLNKKKLKLKYILLTHGHFDHISGIKNIREKTKAKIGINKKDSIMLRHPLNLQIYKVNSLKEDFNFKENDQIKLGSITLRVIETPGHSPASCCFYEEKEKILFSGDTLFCGAVGVTNIPAGNHLDLVSSIKNKIMKLPDDVKVLPGHGYETTVGKERINFQAK